MSKVAIVKDGKVVAIVDDVFSKSITSCKYGFETSTNELHAAKPQSIVNARYAKLTRAKKFLSVNTETCALLLNDTIPEVPEFLVY